MRETGYPDYTLWQMVLVLLNGWTVGVYRGSAFAESVDDVHGVFTGCVALVAGAWWLAIQRRWRHCCGLDGRAPCRNLVGVDARTDLHGSLLIWTASAFYVLVAVGLVALLSIERWFFVPLSALVVILSGVGLYHQAARPLKPQFEPATRYIEAQREPGALVLFLIPQNYDVVSYYAERPLEPGRKRRIPIGGLWMGATRRMRLTWTGKCLD